MVFVSLAQVDISFVGFEIVDLRRGRLAVFAEFDMNTVEDAADGSPFDLDIKGSFPPDGEVFTGVLCPP